ncbi:S-layer homology domain-containing protein [uncultured Oscillibacter sp.]|uniref:S-layer homology domain-containing protein n=1 Tax=uncultured Oscillibacter sp. TaxID=876091 RepID=UPI0028054488|nr:S-layer homology domain-containing protein [uncultured Oscillibacter sp.]
MARKRIFAALLALAVTAGSLALPAQAAFTDTAGHWAETAITKWSEEYSIIGGYDDGTFRPDNSITRGAFAGILDRFLKFQTASPAGTFSDLAGNYWEDAILKLHASGVYLGNNGAALAGDTITRQQAVAMIGRAFDITGETTTVHYLDAERVSGYALPYLAEMSARGYITDSSDGYFRPTDAITRAEIVTILDNMIEALVQTNVTYSRDVEGTVMVNSAEGAALRDMTIAGDLIVAPGVSGPVTLENVTVQGAVRNFSGAEILDLTNRPQKPETIQPSDVYTPSETTGEYLTYSNQQIPVYAGVERNRFAQGDFEWDPDHPGRLIYTGRDYRTRFGIDVSAYQNRASANNTIDWEAAKADGVEFAMVRIGLRGYGSGSIMEDAFYAQNIDGAMAAGIETGVYFFAQAITVEEAIEEADFVINLLKNHEIDGPVAYDWEMHDSSYRVYGTSPEMATACAIAFCQRIEEAGYDAMVYAGQYVSYIKYDQGALEPYLSWYPEYKSASSELLYPTLYYQMDYWQYSSSCTVAGIGGNVDVNLQFIPR